MSWPPVMIPLFYTTLWTTVTRRSRHPLSLQPLRQDEPAATRALKASIPPRIKSLRQSRTVSSRAPKACEMLLLVQPASVSKTARARSASAQSPLPANASSADLSEPVACNGDLPAISDPQYQMPKQNHTRQSLASQNQSALVCLMPPAVVLM